MNSPPNTHDKSKPSFSRNVVVTTILGLSLQSNFIPLLLSVLLDVRLGTLEDLFPLLVGCSASLKKYRSK